MRLRRFENKLVLKLLGAVTISFCVSFGVMVLDAQIVLYLQQTEYLSEQNVAHFNLMNLFMFTTVIFTFIAVLLFLLRKRIMYLKVITENVNEIANGKLGQEIKIEGKDELTQLAENINHMSRELENKFKQQRQLEATKNELITNVSHDLRTPLTSVIGYLDLLKKGRYKDKKQLDEYVDTIYSKSIRLKYLIDELFEYTRLSDSDIKLNKVEVDLSALIEQLVGEYVPIFEKERLTIERNITDENIPVLVDPEKMVRVYENILMNAVKYSLKPSNVIVSFQKKANKAIFKVSNNVETMPVEDVNQLFNRFFTGDKARSEAKGTGLGLAIAKRIMELHQGEIYAEYKDGRIAFIVEHPLH